MNGTNFVLSLTHTQIRAENSGAKAPMRLPSQMYSLAGRGGALENRKLISDTLIKEQLALQVSERKRDAHTLQNTIGTECRQHSLSFSFSLSRFLSVCLSFSPVCECILSIDGLFYRCIASP